MAFVEIPVSIDFKSYTEKVVLDNSVFTFNFRFNDRMARWIMDIMDAEGQPLLMGTPLLIEWPLTKQFNGVIEGLPAQTFLIVDETGQMRNPDLENFGKDVKLIYGSA